MEKRALQLASVASMIDQFNMPNIRIMQSLGYKVDVVADFTNPGTITKERATLLKKCLADMGVRVIDIAIPRSINIKAILSAYKRVKNLVISEHYNLIHCHSPIGGAILRIAARNERKKGTKVIYTAHGFHFYDGAPIKNWLVFYPVEKWLSRYTDILITINQEDYKRALYNFKAKKTEYIPGIGIDTQKYRQNINREKIRKELGLDDSDVMLLSVGELNENKNHEIVIRALSKLKERLCYVVVGKGNKEGYLKKLINELNLQGKVYLVGYRDDVEDFYNAADVFVFPSFREGLSVSLMEAMANSLPVVCGKIRGNTDLIDDDGGIFFNPHNEGSLIEAIHKELSSNYVNQGKHNRLIIKSYDLKKVEELITKAYVSTL